MAEIKFLPFRAERVKLLSYVYKFYSVQTYSFAQSSEKKMLHPLRPSYSWSSFLGVVTGTPEDGPVTSQFYIDRSCQTRNFTRGPERPDGRLIKRRGAQSASAELQHAFISLRSRGARGCRYRCQLCEFILSFPLGQRAGNYCSGSSPRGKLSGPCVVVGYHAGNFISCLTSDASRYTVSPMVVATSLVHKMRAVLSFIPTEYARATSKRISPSTFRIRILLRLSVCFLRDEDQVFFSPGHARLLSRSYET